MSLIVVDTTIHCILTLYVLMMHTVNIKTVLFVYFNIKTVLFVYSFSLDFAQWKEKCNIKVNLQKILLIKRKNDFTQ